jgi:hypothetical protein
LGDARFSDFIDLLKLGINEPSNPAAALAFAVLIVFDDFVFKIGTIVCSESETAAATAADDDDDVIVIADVVIAVAVFTAAVVVVVVGVSLPATCTPGDVETLWREGLGDLRRFSDLLVVFRDDDIFSSAPASG